LTSYDARASYCLKMWLYSFLCIYTRYCNPNWHWIINKYWIYIHTYIHAYTHISNVLFQLVSMRCVPPCHLCSSIPNSHPMIYVIEIFPCAFHPPLYILQPRDLLYSPLCHRFCNQLHAWPPLFTFTSSPPYIHHPNPWPIISTSPLILQTCNPFYPPPLSTFPLILQNLNYPTHDPFYPPFPHHSLI